MNPTAPEVNEAPASSTLGVRGRYGVLVAVFLGWMCAGMEMSLMVPTTRPAIQYFRQALPEGGPARALKHFETNADQWLSWYIASFLLGAALGGLVFGALADRRGRVKAMGYSIICYSGFTGLGYFAQSPEQLLVLRFLACLGVGGMWPTGVSLSMEAWPQVSRPVLAGLIGAAANVGFLILGLVMLYHPITAQSWRWVLLLGASPVVLGLVVLSLVPESPQWLRSQGQPRPERHPVATVFRPPLRHWTLLGIALGTIPLLGGWASGQRLVPWAGQVGDQLGLPQLKATTQTVWAFGAVLGSLLGGWFASVLGQRRSYFLISLGSLALSLYLFLGLTPASPVFPWAAFGLGLIATSFFGWLPYFLPALFPTEVRATGTGVAYNFGRIFSAIAVLASTSLSLWFQGDLAKMGATTSLVYAAGLIVVRFMPRDPE